MMVSALFSFSCIYFFVISREVLRFESLIHTQVVGQLSFWRYGDIKISWGVFPGLN